MRRLRVAVILMLSGCGAKAEAPCTVDTTYDPPIDPGRFTTVIDNPFFPVTPGSRMTFEGGGETIEITVTDETLPIAGVDTVAVRDTVMVSGEITEDTTDWYAQDVDGTVWYFGEDTAEYENGTPVTNEGSWTAGVDGAKPGIIMPAQPAPGPAYRQEYLACHAEDMAEIVSVNETVTVPFGRFTGCVKTHDFTPLDPGLDEEKYYCAGLGVTLEVDVEGQTRTELTDFTPP